MSVIGYTTGVFDLFHVGHLNILRRARAECDYLIVGVTVDELVRYKGKKAFIPYEERREIVEAIHTNPGARDVDGVKRRTRGGMGRCQGGFCSPTVVAILARELGIAFEDVTKFGGDSVINYGKTKGGN